jgi:hypothetical protein
MVLQAIIFSRKKWDEPKSTEWLKEHSYSPIKEAHLTKGFVRYRLAEPNEDKFHYRTKTLPDKTIKYIMGYPQF